MIFKLSNNNVFNVSNDLQDIKQKGKRLMSCRWCHSLLAITRHKTLQTFKLYFSIYTILYYLYTSSLIFNVFNVLFIVIPIFIRVVASRFRFFLTSCNVFNVL